MGRGGWPARSLPAEAFQGRLAESADTLLAALKKSDEAALRLSRLVCYAKMKQDEDNRVSRYQEMFGKAMVAAAKTTAASSFMTPELLALPEDKILKFIQILIIGQYLSQLETIAKEINAPLITGKNTNAERELLYDSFRKGEINVLVVSKVANFAIDLPDASVAIQVSGVFGSRQEEAQRLGRILRPKECDSGVGGPSGSTRRSRWWSHDW